MTSSPRRSTLLSVLIHCAVIAMLIFAAGVKPEIKPQVRYTALVAPDISKYLPTVKRETGGGGGGGARDVTPASFGKLPRFATRQFTQPSPVVMNVNPLLTMEPTLVGNPQPMAMINLPYGDPNGVQGPPSRGPGTGGGIGTGDGTGDGSGKGPGAGPGECCGLGGPGGTGGRGRVTAPIVIYKIEPEYTDEARRARVQGDVILEIEVNTDGRAQNVHIRQSLGLGLDERAMEAVKQWKFRPGQQNGKPIVTIALVQVTFRLL